MFSFNIGFIPIIFRDVTRVYIYAGERATQPYSISGGGGTIFPGSDQLNRSQKTERKLSQHSEKSK